MAIETDSLEGQILQILLSTASLENEAQRIATFIKQRDGDTERQVRESERALIASNLRRYAAGRRIYAQGAGPNDPDNIREMNLALAYEAQSYDGAALIAEEGEEAMYGMPSWMWTRAMNDALFVQAGLAHD